MPDPIVQPAQEQVTPPVTPLANQSATEIANKVAENVSEKLTPKSGAQQIFESVKKQKENNAATKSKAQEKVEKTESVKREANTESKVGESPKQEEKKETPKAEKTGKSKSSINDDELVKEILKERTDLEMPESVDKGEGQKEKEVTEKEKEKVETKPTFDFKAIKKETGIDAKDEKDLVTKINELKKIPRVDTAKVKELMAGKSNIETALAWDNITLVEKKLTWEGMSEADAKQTVEDMIETNGEKSIDIEARKVKAQLNSAHKEISGLVDKELSTPQYEQPKNNENFKEILSELDKTETIAGMAKADFQEIIDEVKGGEYQSITDLIPKDKLAEAIIAYRGLETIKTNSEKKGFKSGFNKAVDTQIRKKVLNQSPEQSASNGRSLPPQSSKGKPDATKFVKGVGAMSSN